VPLLRAIVGCHLVLMAALAASLVPPATALRVGVAALLALPLLLTLRGLAQARRTTLQRLAVLLVAYVGGASVEVVARSGNAPSLSIALIAAVLELGLLLALIRRSGRSAPGRRE
jgi:hypothetical protein